MGSNWFLRENSAVPKDGAAAVPAAESRRVDGIGWGDRDMGRLYVIDPEAANYRGPSAMRRRSNSLRVRLQQIPFAAGFGDGSDCTNGRGRSMLAATLPRSMRRAPWVPSTSRVPRDTNKAPRRNSVVIADSNPVFLCGLASVLQAEGDFVVVASCQDEAESIAAIRALSPSLALLDMSLSDLSGFQVLAAARTEAFLTRVVFLSSSAADPDAAKAFFMGASGVLPKDAAPRLLVRWLRQVMSGQRLVPLAIRNAEPRNAQRSRIGRKPEELVIALTARESQIMEFVSTGLSNREVGERLHISEGTIKVHLHHIFQKLAIRNRTALANIGRTRPKSLRPHNA
jgi:two-component system nitrate/nitrite response regulator NarL